MSTDPRAYLDIEVNLTKRLWKSWRAVSAPFWATVDKALDAGDLGKAYGLANKVDLQPVVDENRDFIRYLLLQAAIFGAKMANNNHKVTATALGVYDETMGRVTDVFCAAILRNVTLAIHGQLLQLIASHDTQHTQKAEVARPRFVKDYVDFSAAGDRQLQMLATLNTSRLAAWGFTAEAEVLGLETYQLSAILDGRTSAFCRLIDGKVFEVPQARTRIVNALSATTPDDLRILQPWPNQSQSSITELKDLSTTQLAERGFSVPPFHPFCRTICRRTKSDVSVVVADVIKPAIPDLPEIGPRTPVQDDSFVAIGAEVTPEQLEFWNNEVGQNPTYVVSQLTGEEPGNIVGTTAGQNIVIDPAKGTTTLPLKGALAGEESVVKVKVVLDAVTEAVEVPTLSISATTPEQAAEYTLRLYEGAISVGVTAGATELVLSAGGTSGAWGSAQLGFLPASDGDWYDLKTVIEHQLDGGDLAWLLDSMTDAQQTLVNTLLSLRDRATLRALSDLPWLVSGMTVGEWLLQDQQYDASLDLTDKTALARYGAST